MMDRLLVFHEELTQIEQKLQRSLRPVVLGMDNASAHKDEAVMAKALELGIRPWYEESKTSHFLQCLDQYFRKWHNTYREAVKEERLIRKNPELKITWEIFTLIVCRTWLTWSTPMDRIRSFRKVGITHLGLRPDLINRATFYMKKDIEDEEANEPVLDTSIPEPEGLEEGSKEYYEEKLASAMALIERLKNVPCTPKEAGVLALAPTTCQERDAGRMRLSTDEHSSCKMKDMVGTKKRRRLENEMERARIDQDKENGAVKKLKEAEDAMNSAAAWATCHALDGSPQCKCGVSPCPWANLRYCIHCGDVKKTQCRKRACLDKIQALPGPTVLAIEGD